MTINTKELRLILKEEIIKILDEFYCHDSKGHFSDCEGSNKTYSLTKKGAESRGVDSRYVKRGNVKGKDSEGLPKVAAKYGVNTSKKKSAGRKTLDGDDISPKYYVSKYPSKYYELNEDDIDESDSNIQSQCARAGYGKPNAIIDRFLKRTSAASSAVKGDYGKQKSG
tara:strand:- start:2783 stop:3286 length:504 start_codon:yes stop_codon:yes gene_type:complete